MKIRTDNKLAHYQVEVNELNEKMFMLRGQYVASQQEVNAIGSYLSVNQGDERARRKYREATTRLKNVEKEIRQVQGRMQTLNNQIMRERNKMMMYGNQNMRRRPY